MHSCSPQPHALKKVALQFFQLSLVARTFTPAKIKKLERQFSLCLKLQNVVLILLQTSKERFFKPQIQVERPFKSGRKNWGGRIWMQKSPPPLACFSTSMSKYPHVQSLSPIKHLSQRFVRHTTVTNTKVTFHSSNSLKTIFENYILTNKLPFQYKTSLSCDISYWSTVLDLSITNHAFISFYL